MKLHFICLGGQPSCDVLVKQTYLLCLGGEQSKAAISDEYCRFSSGGTGDLVATHIGILRPTYCLTSSSSVSRALVLYGGTATYIVFVYYILIVN
jgi:hypothetical protein